jgi:transcriptional regulator with XRE-family HTH domain
MSLADRVRALREQRGLNQKGLADASQITQATISRIESGQVEELRSESLKNLATALGVTVDYLVGRTDRQTGSDIADADPNAKRVLEKYAQLSRIGQVSVLDYVDFIYRKERARAGITLAARLSRRLQGKRVRKIDWVRARRVVQKRDEER